MMRKIAILFLILLSNFAWATEKKTLCHVMLKQLLNLDTQEKNPLKEKILKTNFEDDFVHSVIYRNKLEAFRYFLQIVYQDFQTPHSVQMNHKVMMLLSGGPEELSSKIESSYDLYLDFLYSTLSKTEELYNKIHSRHEQLVDLSYLGFLNERESFELNQLETELRSLQIYVQLVNVLTTKDTVDPDHFRTFLIDLLREFKEFIRQFELRKIN